MTTIHTHNVTNGVDRESLDITVKAIQDNPELGKCTFHAYNKWISGGHNRTRITCFKSLGGEQSHKQPFDVDNDEPKALGGTDKGANPVEHLLNALAACITTSIVAHAAVRDIEIEEIESQLDGDIDLRGFLGLDPKTPKGYQNIRVRFRVKTAPENLPKLKSLAAFSPVYNTLLNGTKVDIQIDPK
jgi:uncharacterized OsmC-like protein